MIQRASGADIISDAQETVEVTVLVTVDQHSWATRCRHSRRHARRSL